MEHETTPRPLDTSPDSNKSMSGHAGGEHEHPDTLQALPIVGSRVFAEIREVMANIMDSDLYKMESYLQLLRAAEEQLQRLDWLAILARRMVYRDVEARQVFCAWLDSQPLHDIVPPSKVSTRFELAPDAQFSGIDVRHSILNIAPITDILIAIAYDIYGNDDLLNQRCQKVLDLLSQWGPAVNMLYDLTSGYKQGRVGAEVLPLVLDQFSRVEGRPLLPDNLRECLIEIIHTIGNPKSALALSRHLQDDNNNDALIQVSPTTVHAGHDVITLSADSAKPFDATQPTDVQVFFVGSNPVAGQILSWTSTTIQVKVPEEAQSGPIYFARVRTTDDLELQEIQATKMDDITTIQEACPLFDAPGGISSGLLNHFYMSLPSGNCMAPASNNYLKVIHAPVIASFKAFDRRGLPLEGVSTAFGEPVTLQWRVNSDDSTPPQVALLVPGRPTITGLSANGSWQMRFEHTQTITLRASNGCGQVTQDTIIGNGIINPPPPPLSASPTEISLLKGQSTLLLITILEFAGRDGIELTIVNNNPHSVTVPESASIPPYTNGVAISVNGTAPGQPSGAPAAILTIQAAGFISATVRIWVEDPAGQWRISTLLDMVGVHSALLKTGKVLLFAMDETDYNAPNKGKSRLWDPATEQMTIIPWPNPRNLFCSGHCFLQDGRLFVAGGQAFPGILSWGADHDIHTFDPDSEMWSQFNPMPSARWYPTCLTLPDGFALIISGSYGGGTGNPFYAINEDFIEFDPVFNDLIIPQQAHFLSGIDIYPFLKLLPGGTLFVHYHDISRLFIPDASSTSPLGRTLSPTPYYTASKNTRTYPGQGACVLLPLLPDQPDYVRLLIVGGGDETMTSVNGSTLATNTTEIFDFRPSRATLGQLQLGWRPTATHMSNRRFMSDAVLLPDGTVLVVGGAGQGQASDNSNPVLMAELFDPVTESWQQMASMQVERRYHSTALLLPDGRVLTAGSTGAKWPPNQFEQRLEIFSPPYLFRGPRPKITQAPLSISYGQTFDIGTQNEQDIASVALIHPSSVTHTNNMDQRYVGLAITARSTQRVTVMAPPDPTFAPPGFYMLFLINQKRIPSEADFLQLM